MSKTGTDASFAIDHWPTWKVLLLVVPIFGVLGALVGLLPTYAPEAMALGMGMALVVILATPIGVKTKSWYTQVLYIGIWCGMFVAIGARHWAALLPNPWVWYLLHLFLYATMWALPGLSPRLSAFLEREQRYPETELGLGCFRIFMVIGPAAGILGASIAMYGPRFGLDNWVTLFVAVASTAGGLGLLQYFTHHLWQDRPWADSKPTSRQIEAY